MYLQEIQLFVIELIANTTAFHECLSMGPINLLATPSFFSCIYSKCGLVPSQSVAFPPHFLLAIFSFFFSLSSSHPSLLLLLTPPPPFSPPFLSSPSPPHPSASISFLIFIAYRFCKLFSFSLVQSYLLSILLRFFSDLQERFEFMIATSTYLLRPARSSSPSSFLILSSLLSISLSTTTSFL